MFKKKSTGKERWPVNLEEILDPSSSEYDQTVKVRIKLAPGVEDVTYEPDAHERLRNYLPDIRQVGIGLFFEKWSTIWGGLLVRVLQTTEKRKKILVKKRCLQYIYTWTKQQSAVSMLWMVIVPFLMAGWGYVIYTFYNTLVLQVQLAASTDFWSILWPPSALWLPGLLTGGVSLPLLLSGLWDHRHDVGLEGGIAVRSTSLMTIYAIMMWFIPLSWWIAVMIGVFAFITLVYWILDQVGIAKSSHPMDYLPVFVWIEKAGDAEWKFVEASWDKFHYKGETKKRKDLEEVRFSLMTPNLDVRETDSGEEIARVRLQMDNPWHSVRPGGHVTRLLMGVSFGVLAICCLIIGYLGEFNLWLGFPSYGAHLAVTLFFAIFALRTILRFPSILYSLDEYKKKIALPKQSHEMHQMNFETRNHLSEDRLETLWNLVKIDKDSPDIRPRFVIITKMQDPFNFYEYDSFLKTYRDDLEYLYEYITTRCPITEDQSAAMIEAKEKAAERGVKLTPRVILSFSVPDRVTVSPDRRQRALDSILERTAEGDEVTEDMMKELL